MLKEQICDTLASRKWIMCGIYENGCNDVAFTKTAAMMQNSRKRLQLGTTSSDMLIFYPSFSMPIKEREAMNYSLLCVGEE